MQPDGSHLARRVFDETARRIFPDGLDYDTLWDELSADQKQFGFRYRPASSPLGIAGNDPELMFLLVAVAPVVARILPDIQEAHGMPRAAARERLSRALEALEPEATRYVRKKDYHDTVVPAVLEGALAVAAPSTS